MVRAIRAAKKADLTIARVDVDPASGRIVIWTSEPPRANDADKPDLDERLRRMEAEGG